MKFTNSLKQKYIFIISTVIVVTFSITYSILYALCFTYYEQLVIEKIISLLEWADHDFQHIQDAIDWSDRNLDKTIYLYNSVEELTANIPFETTNQSLLSPIDIQQLEQGEMIINKINISSKYSIPILLFFYPIMEDGSLQHILFLYYPINDLKQRELMILLGALLIVSIAAGMTFLFAKNSFMQTYRQLRDIKQATKEIARGNYETKIWRNSADEIGEISEGFNIMASALKDERERTKDFMEDISHEIKTPLTYIKTYNQALLDGIIQDPNEVRKSYRLIDRETSRLQKLIQNLLDFTKLDAQAIELDKQPIVFAQSIEEIMMKYEPIFQKMQLTLTMKLDYDVIIHADEERLEQIIQNIVDNAIRYSKENPSISLTLEKQDHHCILAISDNGVGISEEHLSIITNRFVRVNKVSSRKETGMGIGLSIVEKLMDLHEGSILIESQLGVGTTVKLMLPILESMEDEETTVSSC